MAVKRLKKEQIRAKSTNVLVLKRWALIKQGLSVTELRKN